MSNIQLTPQPGEYFTREGNESKLILNQVKLTYSYLSQKDICLPDAADAGDLGIVINGTIKNEYPRDYYIMMSTRAFNSKGKEIGVITDSGPICGTIVFYAERGQIHTFEMHLKYRENIEQIVIYASAHERRPP